MTRPVKRTALFAAAIVVLSGLALAESYFPIVRAELVEMEDDSHDPSFHVVLTNVRNPSGSAFERKSARFDTVSIEKDGKIIRSNIFCKCGTSGPCGAPRRTIDPGDSASYFWDGRSDMCEALKPGSYAISVSLRCQDQDAIYRSICQDNPKECSQIDACFEYREEWLIHID